MTRRDQRRTVLFPAPPAPQAVIQETLMQAGNQTMRGGASEVPAGERRQTRNRRMLYLPPQQSPSSHLGSASEKQQKQTKKTHTVYSWQ